MASSLETNARVEAEIFDLLHCHSSWPDTGGLAAGSAYDIP